MCTYLSITLMTLCSQWLHALICHWTNGWFQCFNKFSTNSCDNKTKKTNKKNKLISDEMMCCSTIENGHKKMRSKFMAMVSAHRPIDQYFRKYDTKWKEEKTVTSIASKNKVLIRNSTSNCVIFWWLEIDGTWLSYVKRIHGRWLSINGNWNILENFQFAWKSIIHEAKHSMASNFFFFWPVSKLLNWMEIKSYCSCHDCILVNALIFLKSWTFFRWNFVSSRTKINWKKNVCNR